MEQISIAVMGAGSVRCMPAVIGSLATYFGERPLDIRFWDADTERLDLFDRFARLCFAMNKCTHRLTSTEDPDEALDGVSKAIVTVGENCARLYLKKKGSLLGHGETAEPLIHRTVSEVLDGVGPDVSVLSLVDMESVRGFWCYLPWPAEPDESNRRALPHQVLRFLIGDEYPHAFLRSYSDSPIKDWLDGRELADAAEC